MICVKNLFKLLFMLNMSYMYGVYWLLMLEIEWVLNRCEILGFWDEIAWL